MKSIFLLPILALVVFSIFFYLVIPSYQTKARLKEKVEEKSQELLRAKEDLVLLSQIKENLKEHEEAKAKIESALPDSFSLADFLNYLQKETANNGLILTSFSEEQGGGQGAEEGGLKEHFVHLAVSGSWQALESLIAALEKSSRLINVESVASGKGEEDELQFGLQLKVYSY